MIYNNLNENNKKCAQPIDMTIELMEHQKTIVYAMLTLEKTGLIEVYDMNLYDKYKDFSINTGVGILSDKVGSGKSLMAVALIDLCRLPLKKPICLGGTKYVSIQTKKNIPYINTNLLIVPHKIVPQWIDFIKYSPLKYATYISIDDEKKLTTEKKLEKYDIVVISCTKSIAFFDKFPNKRWGRVLIDEADSIRIPQYLEINTAFLWLITATPRKMRFSKSSYLTTIFKNMLPWVFDNLIIKNNDSYVDKSIKLPKPNRLKIYCKTPPELAVIKHLIPKNIVTMINAGNTDEAIKALNCNVDTNDNILQVVTSNIQEALKNKKIELRLEKKKKYKTNSKAKKVHKDKLKQINKQIERLNTKYDSIKEKIYKLNDEYCPVCMNEFEKPTVVSCCNNLFCFDCIALTTSNNKCPYCRQEINKEDLHVIDNTIDNKRKNKKVDKQNKIDILLDIIKAKPKGKFMVFANYAQTFKKIELVLADNNISYNILKGQSHVVKQAIYNFESGKTTVLMLNARFFGAGMNLQMATDVIIYHRFDRELEEQVIGRAHRLGRTSKLNIFYLLHNNENANFDNDDKFEEIDYYDWLSGETSKQNDLNEVGIKNIKHKDIKNIMKIK